MIRKTFMDVYNKILKYSNKDITKVNINNYIKGREVSINNRIDYSCVFLKNEIPIRLAKRIKELDNLPIELSSKPSVNQVRNWYIESFYDFYDDQKNNVSNEELLNTCEIVYKRHENTLVKMAQGIKEADISKLDKEKLKYFLDNFYINRIDLRFLLGQYIEYFDEKENHIGLINMETDIVENVKNSLISVENITNINNLDFPKVNINYESNIKIPYIPSYLNYVLTEILKNSVKSINDRYTDEKITYSDNLLNVNLYDDEHLLVIKISDKGQGIKEHDMNKIWNYTFSTTNINTDDLHGKEDFGYNSLISGLGYGLPISKLYLKYFNNYINIFSKYNYGTDVYITIRKNTKFN